MFCNGKHKKNQEVLSTELLKMDRLRYKNIFELRWHLLTLAWWLIAFIWFLTQWKSGIQLQEIDVLLKITIISFLICVLCIILSSIFIPMYDLQLISFNRRIIKDLKEKIDNKTVVQNDINTYNHQTTFGYNQKAVTFIWKIIQMSLRLSVLTGILSLTVYYLSVMF